MNLGSLIIPILGGYWFLTHCYFTKYSVLRDAGYHLFFRSAFAGIVLVIFAHIAIYLLDHSLPEADVLWKFLMLHGYDGAAVLSVILGVVSSLVLNLFYDQEKALQKAAEERGNFVELIIAESLERGMLVEISLRNRKSYVGFAIGSRIISRGESDVEVVPLASGYRDKDTQELKFTSNYAPFIQTRIVHGSGTYNFKREDLRVVIPTSEIVSARIFIPEVYQRFQDKQSTNGDVRFDGQ